MVHTREYISGALQLIDMFPVVKKSRTGVDVSPFWCGNTPSIAPQSRSHTCEVGLGFELLDHGPSEFFRLRDLCILKIKR